MEFQLWVWIVKIVFSSFSFSSTLVHCTVARVKSSVSLPCQTWNQVPKIFWWPLTLLVVVLTSRTYRWSSTTIWPKPLKTTRIVSVELVELASTEQPYPSSPKTTRLSSTIWSSYCSPVPYRRARQNWPTIRMLSTNRVQSSSVNDVMRRSLPEGTSGKKLNRISSFASEMLAILMLSQREIHFFFTTVESSFLKQILKEIMKTLANTLQDH